MPLTSSVEKTVNLHEFKDVYKSQNINVVLVNVDHNDMAVHLTRSDFEGL
jgi:hypothetical protein